MDGVLIFLVLGGLLLTALWVWGELVRPLRQLQRLIHDLAEGRKPSGFVARGKLGLKESIGQLERVAEKLEGVTTREKMERLNLNAILGSLTEGVLVVNREGRIDLANEEFLRMFALEEISVGRTVMEATRLVELDRAVGEINEGEGTRNLEVQVGGGEAGQVQTLAVNLAPIVEGNRERSGVVVVFHDLSKIRRLEMVRQEFVTNLSHELRTPLSILAGYLETLEDPKMLRGEEGKRIWGVLRRNSERLTLLVGDLLELSRIESGRMELKMVSRAPREILQEVQEDWRRAFDAKRVKIRLDCPSGLPAVRVDPLRVGQVFSNLMENALGFAPIGSEVVLAARMGDLSGEVEFTVRDEGEGIPADKVGRIFERFFRVDPGRVREKGGTGLGLSIVKHLVQLHGGKVWAKSGVGLGTQILLTLPAGKG
ncbi:MAG: PAS domain S-box protein [Verrucomicrobia bacterium]|nr:PAS domain S-box protein [Verrucomicrobiota bacterium]NBS79120.1 PAS domain S-box protein [bacterium]NBT23650.1 PAS domain S-box protein [bacterium]NBV96634.1 PAS domain S-box protein [Verrucomicrobiota bacterium]NBY65980.1 PAS domain S-box protein [Verrucomicrobiota bacterium]